MTAILALLLLVPQAPDDSARARTLLNAAVAGVKDVPALSYEEESTQAGEDGHVFGRRTSRVTLKRPFLLRIETASTSGDILRVLDGAAFWYYETAGKLYIRYPQSEEVVNTLLLREGESPFLHVYLKGDLTRFLAGAEHFRVTRDTLEDGAFDLISWDRAAGGNHLSFKLWFDDRGLPRRYSRATEWKNGSVVETQDYRKVSLSPALSGDLFSFAPPPGAQNKLLFRSDGELEAALKTPSARDAQRILEEVQAVFRKAPGLFYSSDAVMDAPGLPLNGSRQHARTWIKRPNVARIERSAAGEDALTVFDGSHRWSYSPGRKEYRRSYLWETPEPFRIYLTDPVPQLFAETGRPRLLIEASKITLTRELDGGNAFDVIGWTRRGAQGPTRVQLWIDAEKRPRRLVEEDMIEGQRLTQTTLYGTLDLSPDLGPVSFSFTPPQGSRDAAQVGPRPARPSAPQPELPPSPEETDRGKELLSAAETALAHASGLRYRVNWTRIDRSSSYKVIAKVSARRPAQVRYEMSGSSGDDEDDKGRTDSALYVLDGKTCWMWGKEGAEETYHSISQSSVRHDFCFDLSLSMFLDRSADKVSLATEIRGGRGDLEGKTYDRVSWKIQYSTERYQVWLDEARRVRRVEKRIEGDLAETLEYQDYEESPTFKDGEFAFTPPRGARLVGPPPESQNALLVPGTPAPDFEVMGFGGKALRLSMLKGKPVLLHFWVFS